MPLAHPNYQLLHPLMSSKLIGASSNLGVVVLFDMIWVNLNCITAVNYVMWLGAVSKFSKNVTLVFVGSSLINVFAYIASLND